jgi:hypothetical protein
MSIRVRRFPEYEVNLHIYSGAVTAEEVFRHFARLEPTRWIGYFDPSADVTALDVASLPKLKQALADKRQALFGERPSPSVIVYSSREVEKFFRFWRRYIANVGERPITVVLFGSLEGACGWLGLPDPARQAIMAAAGVDPLAEPSRTLEAGGGGRRSEGARSDRRQR